MCLIGNMKSFYSNVILNVLAERYVIFEML